MPYRVPKLSPPSAPISPGSIWHDCGAILAVIGLAIGSLAVPQIAITRAPERLPIERASDSPPECNPNCGPSRYCCQPTAFTSDTGWSATGFSLDGDLLRAYGARSPDQATTITNELE